MNWYLIASRTGEFDLSYFPDVVGTNAGQSNEQATVTVVTTKR